MTKSKKRKPLELPPQKPSLHTTASSRITTNTNSSQKVDNQVSVGGDVTESTIILGDNNTISYSVVNRKSRFGLQIFLGILLPIFACVLTLAVYIVRFLLNGVWFSDTTETITTASILIGVFVFSFILLVVGISRLGKATINYVSQFRYRYFYETLKEGMKQILFYLKEHPNWIDAIKNMFWFNKKGK